MTRVSLIAAAALAAIGAASPQQTTFKSGVEAVRLDVSVMRGGQPVRGLSAGDFNVTDNKVTQRVDKVATDALPLSVFLVLDTSGSVAGERLSHLIDAGKTLISALHPDDRAALITFSADVTARVPLTNDRQAITSALGALEGRGPTSIRDAVHVALQLRPDDESRPVVLVFTDGQDTSSWLSAADVVASARRSGVVIYAVSLVERQTTLVEAGRPAIPPDSRAADFLDRLAAAAGGRHWPASSSAELRPLFVRVLDEMRARYLLSFYPQGVTQPGWHDLKVSLNRGRADVRARPGYFVPRPGTDP
jgi:Ca-activated chloride channel homolog